VLRPFEDFTSRPAFLVGHASIDLNRVLGLWAYQGSRLQAHME
jgi:hypothetical protein